MLHDLRLFSQLFFCHVTTVRVEVRVGEDDCTPTVAPCTQVTQLCRKIKERLGRVDDHSHTDCRENHCVDRILWQHVEVPDSLPRCYQRCLQRSDDEEDPQGHDGHELHGETKLKALACKVNLEL